MRRVWTVIVLAAALAAPPAGAQQSGPIRLAPLPPVNGGTGGDASETEPEDVRPGGIRVQGLESVGEDSLGTIGDEGGGLGRDMWAGTQRVDAVRLLSAMPDSYPLRAGYDLARRLLSTAARAPAAVREGQGMLAPRIDRLAAVGAGEQAVALARSAQGAEVPDHLAGAVVRAHFAEGAIGPGCQAADGYGGDYQSVFWQQVLIVCQVASGDAGQVGLGLDLLRDQGIAVDPVFADAALAASAGGEIALERREDGVAPDILTLALLVASGAALPGWLADDLRPGLLPALLEAANASAELKLRAAHRALRLGVVDGFRVAEVYHGLDAADDAITAALTAPDSVDPDRLLAYLYLAADRQAEPIPRSEVLARAWREARNIEAFGIAALTTAELLSDVPVTPDFGWLAADAVQVSLLAGRNEQAMQWYRLVRRQAPIVPELASAGVELWPAMRTIGREAGSGFSLHDGTSAVATLPRSGTPARGPVPWSAARLERWIELTSAADPVPDHAVVLVMLASLGDSVDDAQWRLLPTGEAAVYTMPGAGALAGARRAAKAGRKAETALYVLRALGQSGRAPHPSVIGTAVAALAQAGLDADARAIARETVARQLDPGRVR